MPGIVKLPERALTLWRPWDQAILYGGKNVENRPWALWRNMIDEPMALHAGKTYDEEGATDMAFQDLYDPPPSEESPLGVVGVFTVGRVIHIDNCDGDPEEENDWFFGPFGWVVVEKFPLPEPIPCRGKQGLWPLPHDVRCEMARQLGLDEPPAPVGISPGRDPRLSSRATSDSRREGASGGGASTSRQLGLFDKGDDDEDSVDGD